MFGHSSVLKAGAVLQTDCAAWLQPPKFAKTMRPPRMTRAGAWFWVFFMPKSRPVRMKMIIFYTVAPDALYSLCLSRPAEGTVRTTCPLKGLCDYDKNFIVGGADCGPDNLPAERALWPKNATYLAICEFSPDNLPAERALWHRSNKEAETGVFVSGQPARWKGFVTQRPSVRRTGWRSVRTTRPRMICSFMESQSEN